MTLLSDYSENQQKDFLGETLGHAVLDSGCTSTVCGSTWLLTYLETISSNEKVHVVEKPSSKLFRFGDGKTYKSLKSVTIPIYTGSQRSLLTTDVVECDIPLLLSNSSLKKAKAHLDFGSEAINFLGEVIPIKITQSGHYCIQLSREPTHQSPDVKKIMFTSPINPDNPSEAKNNITKLHKQFAHPHPNRLKKLISDSGIKDTNIMKIVQDVSDSCEICKKFKKPPHRPVVGFPTATSFGEVVAMDLKDIAGFKVLHMIDHATRYSSACVIPNKQKETIVKAILQFWVRVFGSPQHFLFDNGGEFVNDEMIQFAEQFSVIIKTTAAESPWSNGLCERHNAILADLTTKVMNDNSCSIQIALCWALAAKNSLTNVYGFSPNQLVFGRNTNLPSVHNDLLPAQNTPTSEYIQTNLQALHTARKAFIEQESSEKLRRALNRQTRSYSDNVFKNGDMVYFYRNNSKEWHGPAKVLGTDGQQCLLKNGGMYIRVHPCRMQLYNSPETQTIRSSKRNENVESMTTVHPQDSDENDTIDEHPHTIATNELQPVTHEDDNDPIPENTPPDHETIQRDIVEEPDISIPHSELEPSCIQSKNSNNNDDPEPKESRALSRLKNFNVPGRKESTLLAMEEDPNILKEDPNTQSENILFGTETNSLRFTQAKLEEIQKWKEMDTFQEVENLGQPTISCRWVCTEKVKGNELSLKARLVARGFEEDTSQIKTDSPTCSKESIRLLLSILSSLHWTMFSIDIKSAYLQGHSIQRDIYLKPPKEANTNKIWKLKKNPYGLADAGRQWYVKVQKELSQLGAVQSRLDNAMFIWYSHETENVMGIMVVHVDDFLYGGSKFFHNSVMRKFRTIFQIGLEESNQIRYLGLTISELEEGIELNTKGYGAGCKEIDTSSLGSNRERKLLPSEITLLKQLCGQLNWVTTHSRPDIAFENCMIGNGINNATVRDIFSANRVLRRLRDNELTLFFPRMNIQKCSLVGFCDASFANLPDNGSQGAYLIFLIDDTGSYSLISWQSRRIRRVVHSTIAAECLAAVETAESCAYLKETLKEMLGKKCRDIPITILCDNKSLVDHLHSSTSIENKRLRIDISVLRDMLQRDEISQFKWIPTDIQVANGLTKKGCSTLYLYEILQNRLQFDISSGAFIPRH